jgi:hypothetical protein
VSSVFRACVAALAVLLIAPSASFAQQSKSAALAAELTALMDQMKLDSVAARSADHFVGALYFPGSQLLVIKAKYSAPDHINYLIGAKSYRDAYVELNATTDQESKLFVSDLGANGLHFKREKNLPFDTAEMAGKTFAFDGAWSKAKLSEQDYTKAYTSTDEQYAQMLQALIAALKKPS